MTQGAYHEDEGVTLFLGDCVDVMKTLDAESIDAIVTDPPYGLEFMGKEWDRLLAKDRHVDYPSCRSSHGPNAYIAGLAAQEWHHAWALEALRVLKPGGHMVAFGGTRTHHRLTCAVEDAGFEVRDCLMWIYGSGFPKSLDVSKAMDKAAGAKREAIGKGKRKRHAAGDLGLRNRCPKCGKPKFSGNPCKCPAPDAITDAARQWQGWGTALKPAWEPILLARKPIEKNVAHNVQKHGTGALNIAATRVGVEERSYRGSGVSQQRYSDGRAGLTDGRGREMEFTASGRWPANLVLDEEAAAMLDAQTGELVSGNLGPQHTDRGKAEGTFGAYEGREIAHTFGGDSGGASRFFYTSKAGPDERGGTKHPTVKPRDLMLWLCKVITPPGGLILDPFIGSGTTAVAARMGGFRCIGIDNNKEYLSHAAERLRLGDEGLCTVNEARKQGHEQLTLFQDREEVKP